MFQICIQEIAKLQYDEKLKKTCSHLGKIMINSWKKLEWNKMILYD